jgi:hypothetical protein
MTSDGAHDTAAQPIPATLTLAMAVAALLTNQRYNGFHIFLMTGRKHASYTDCMFAALYTEHLLLHRAANATYRGTNNKEVPEHCVVADLGVTSAPLHEQLEGPGALRHVVLVHSRCSAMEAYSCGEKSRAHINAMPCPCDKTGTRERKRALVQWALRPHLATI